MKIEALKVRIENTTNKIMKVQGTLKRHNDRLDKMKKSLIEKNIDLENYNKYDKSVINDNLYWELCEYEHKLEDIKNNENKLNKLKITLEKLNNSFDVELKKENDINNVIPKCLIEFLEKWKENAKDYYIKLANEYIELKYKKYEVTKDELQEIYIKKMDHEAKEYKIVRRYSDKMIEEILKSDYLKYEAEIYINNKYYKKFLNNHFASDIYIIEKIIDSNKVNLNELREILDSEVKEKKENFVTRVKEVVGVIEDMNNFTLDHNGEINGIAIGKKCKARVKTISAGGYNIQCFHYRVLINKIK